MSPAGARPRLRVVLAREQPEPNRCIEVDAGGREAARRFARDVFEVWRVATDHRSDGYDRVIPLGCEQMTRRHRKLPRARNPNHVHVVGRDTMTHQGVQRPVDETFDDLVVEAAGNDRKAPLRPRWRTREFRHYDASKGPSLSRFVLI